MKRIILLVCLLSTMLTGCIETDLKIMVGAFRTDEVGFFNEHLTEHDIVFTWGIKPWLLEGINRAKTAVTSETVEGFLPVNFPVDYICYGPEQWGGGGPDDLIEDIKEVRAIADQKKALLGFGTDRVLLNQYGIIIAPLVDLFGIQMQNFQGLNVEQFKAKAVEFVSIVRQGSESVPIYIQVSTKYPNVRDYIRAVRDLADGIILLYTPLTIQDMEQVIIWMKQGGYNN